MVWARCALHAHGRRHVVRLRQKIEPNPPQRATSDGSRAGYKFWDDRPPRAHGSEVVELCGAVREPSGAQAGAFFASAENMAVGVGCVTARGAARAPASNSRTALAKLDDARLTLTATRERFHSA
jgi:hypothetical protein